MANSTDNTLSNTLPLLRIRYGDRVLMDAIDLTHLSTQRRRVSGEYLSRRWNAHQSCVSRRVSEVRASGLVHIESMTKGPKGYAIRSTPVGKTLLAVFAPASQALDPVPAAS